MNPRKIDYFEAKQLVPDGPDYLRVFAPYREKDNKHYFFLIFEGDTILDELNLQSEEYEMDILAVIINGSLRASNIYTHDVEGTMHLIILGNLIADNMVVGGQDIYVGGSLQVNSIFMGCYNHGTILVKSSVNCPTIILKDYTFLSMGYVDGRLYGDSCIHLPYKPHDKLICPEEEQELEAIFDSSVIDEYGVEFSRVLERVIKNQSVLKSN